MVDRKVVHTTRGTFAHLNERISKEDLLRLLDEMRYLVACDDTFGGKITYSYVGTDEFLVATEYRIGNSAAGSL